MTNYSLELEYCDGENDDTIHSTKSCEIPIASLKAAPFSLVDGDSVQAKVVAFNTIGDSPESTLGAGAVIASVPS